MARGRISYGQAVVIDIAVGMAAGLDAAAVMQGFQAAAARQIDGLAGGEPATAKAADCISEAVAEKSLPEKSKQRASAAVHYAVGAIIGGVYGVIAGLVPIVTVGRGLAFAVGVWALDDELTVPALGFAPRASETSAEKHAYGAASHAVFALTTDTVRRKLNEWISAE